MRNLKRVISLALAAMMLLSVMVITSSAATEIPKADFSDMDDVAYQEAVEIMVALGVIDGMDDGTFDPNGILTREQAAKLLCYMLLGPTNAENLTANSSVFPDVAADRWSAGYIAYCSNVGILAGDDYGLFDPAGQLTGVAFGKMLLVALGYDPAIEQYVNNANWATNIAADMVSAGVAVNGTVLSNPLTREQAAQMCYQSLTADMVSYASKGTVFIDAGGNQVVINASPATPVTSYSGIKASETGNYAGDNENCDGFGTRQLCEQCFPALRCTASEDAFQRPSTLWRYDGIAIGNYPEDATLTYTKGVNGGTIYTDLGLTAATKKDVISITYAVNGKYEALPSKTENGTTTSFDIERDNKFNIGGNGVLTQVFKHVDISGRISIEITLINTYVGKVSSVTKASGNTPRSITLSQFNLHDVPNLGNALNTKFETNDFASKDVVLYTAAWNRSTDKYDIQTVSALGDPITGRLTKWNGNAVVTTTSGNATNDFTVDSTTYKYDVDCVAVGADGSQIEGVWKFNVNESDLDVYLDEYGYAIYVAGVEGEQSYATVIGLGSTNPYGDTTNGATLLLADGTKVAVTFKMKSGQTVLGNLTTGNTVNEAKGDIVRYRVLDDGTYELEALATHSIVNNDAAGDITFTNGKSALTLHDATTDAVKTLYTTSNTIFMVCTDGSNGKEYNVYTGYNAMPGIKSNLACTSLAYVTNSYYKTQIDVIYLAYASMDGVTSVDTYFAKKAKADIITDSTGKYYVLPAVVNGEVTEVKVDADLVIAAGEGVPSIDLSNNNLSGVFAVKNVTKDKNGIITSCTNAADAFNATNKSSVTGTVAPNGVVLGIGANGNVENAVYWAYNNSTQIYSVSKNFDKIEVIDISSVGTDTNDLVYATTNSGTVKTLKDVFIVEKDDTTTGSTTNVAAADDYAVTISSDNSIKLLVYTGCETKTDRDVAIAAIQAELEKAGNTVESKTESGTGASAKVEFKVVSSAGVNRTYTWTYGEGTGNGQAWDQTGVKVTVNNTSKLFSGNKTIADLGSTAEVGNFAKVSGSSTSANNGFKAKTTTLVDGATYDIGYYTVAATDSNSTYELSSITGATKEGAAYYAKKDAEITVVMAQETAANLPTTYVVAVTGLATANGAEASVTKAGVAAAAAVADKYEAYTAITDAASFADALKAGDVYTGATVDVKQKVPADAAYDGSATYMKYTPGTPEVTAVKGEITITFTMTAQNEAITAVSATTP